VGDVLIGAAQALAQYQGFADVGMGIGHRHRHGWMTGDRDV
jgi:ABC-type uncharacterized transport system permease subunit